MNEHEQSWRVGNLRFNDEMRIDIRLLYCSEIAVPDIVVVVASAQPNWEGRGF